MATYSTSKKLIQIYRKRHGSKYCARGQTVFTPKRLRITGRFFKRSGLGISLHAVA